MQVLFLDTIVFLQCPAIKTLPWREISDQNDLLLLVPRAVQQEIDRLKQDGNSRRAKRARSAASLLKEIVRSTNSALRVRDVEPKVEMSFAPRRLNSSLVYPGLDPSRSDDSIVAEALAYRQENPLHHVALLTDDSGLLMSCKALDLPYVIIPDAWFLPPEQDARDKKIAELEAQIKEFERDSPEIEISARLKDGEVITHLEIRVTTLEPLSELDEADVLAKVQLDSPLQTEFRQSAPDGISERTHYFEPPSEAAIKKYKEEEYPKWIERVREFLSNLPKLMEERSISLEFVISNIGRMPAENVIVSFHCEGDLLFLPPGDEAEMRPKIYYPSPPDPPKGKWSRILTPIEQLVGSFNGLGSHLTALPGPTLPSTPLSSIFPMIPERIDRHGFYWRPRKPHSASRVWELECEEFRHQMNPEIFHAQIHVPPFSDRLNGVVQCRVTARNLRKPACYNLPVSVIHQRGSTLGQALLLLKERQSRSRREFRDEGE